MGSNSYFIKKIEGQTYAMAFGFFQSHKQGSIIKFSLITLIYLLILCPLEQMPFR